MSLPSAFCRGTVARAVLLLAAVLLWIPTASRPAEAQTGHAVVGGVGGLVAGGWTTLGAFVGRSRMGQYFFDIDDVAQIRLETAPVFLFPVAGAVLGANAPERLEGAGIGAGLGFVGGTLVGATVGAWFGEAPEAPWAGGIVGSAAGLVLGAVVGGVVAEEDEPVPGGAMTTQVISIRIPVGGRP